MLLLPSALDWTHPKVHEAVGKADFIMFQRNVLDKVVWNAMDYWRASGRVVTVDLDDHYPNIPPSNPAYPYWIQNKGNLDPVPVQRLKEGLLHADALISPSHVILRDWSHIVPGYYWPNYPSIKEYQDIPPRPRGASDVMFGYKEKDGKTELVGTERVGSEEDIIIGWGGSISHLDSFAFSGVLEGMRLLMEEDKRVKFKFCSHDYRLQYLWDKLPKDQFISQPGVMPNEWPKVVAGFDIGIAPMDMRKVEAKTGLEEDVDNLPYSYDERRSWLKLVEYICAGIPWVATDCAAYKDLGRFGKLVQNTPSAWYNALKGRVGGIATYKQEALKTREYALKHYTQEANADKLIQLYERIGGETQARRYNARLPEVIYLD